MDTEHTKPDQPLPENDRRSDRISEWMIERYALGELDPEQHRAVEARLAADPEAAAELERLRESDRAVLRRYPPAQMAREIRTRAGLPARSFLPRRPGWLLVPAVAAAVLVFVLFPRSVVEPPHEPSSQELGTGSGLRDKGLQPRLSVYRLASEGEHERLADGATAAAGDRIQVSYVAAARGYGVILSVDGRGQATLHFPASETESTRLVPGREVYLPDSYRLDDAPEFERFFFVTSGEPLGAAAIMDAARSLGADPDRARLGTLELDPDAGDVQQMVVTVLKARGSRKAGGR